VIHLNQFHIGNDTYLLSASPYLDEYCIEKKLWPTCDRYATLNFHRHVHHLPSQLLTTTSLTASPELFRRFQKVLLS
jgi:hypothetical protein